jgi:hypothetical protein
MEQRVKDILECAFPGIKVDTEVLPGGRVSGSVVWEGFAGLDHVDRQSKIRTLLREKLGADAQQVGVLLTYTPAELKAMNAA